MRANPPAMSILRMLLLWLACIALRALPWRIPNLEPVLAATLPVAAVWGTGIAVAFPLTMMVVFDVIAGAVGIWTPVTALAYAGVGLWASAAFRGKALRPASAGFFAILATIAYDIVTATLGPLAFGQGWVETYVGQVPFTVNHVVGNVLLCALVSPLLQRWLRPQQRLSMPSRHRHVRI